MTDGEWHSKEVGRYGAPLELHFQREDENRYYWEEDSVDGAANEPIEEPRTDV